MHPKLYGLGREPQLCRRVAVAQSLERREDQWLFVPDRQSRYRAIESLESWVGVGVGTVFEIGRVFVLRCRHVECQPLKKSVLHSTAPREIATLVQQDGSDPRSKGLL